MKRLLSILFMIVCSFSVSQAETAEPSIEAPRVVIVESTLSYGFDQYTIYAHEFIDGFDVYTCRKHGTNLRYKLWFIDGFLVRQTLVSYPYVHYIAPPRYVYVRPGVHYHNGHINHHPHNYTAPKPAYHTPKPVEHKPAPGPHHNVGPMPMRPHNDVRRSPQPRNGGRR